MAAPAAITGHLAMTDALGDILPAGPWPRRIISLSPNLTEILFAAGVDSTRIIGVTRYCDFPAAARRRPKIGGILDPSLEEIQMRSPDLVLAARGNPVEILRRIRGLGFPVFAVDDRTGLAGVAAIIRSVVALTGPEDAVRRDSLLHRVDWDLRSYSAWSDSLRPGGRPGVYYVDPEHPEWTAGPGSHVDDLIRLAGGRNVIDEGGAWPQISAERLALLGPKVSCVLVALPEGAGREAIVRKLRALPGWSSMNPLLRDGGAGICWCDAGELLRPGPRLFNALEELAACLHPGGAIPPGASLPHAAGR